MRTNILLLALLLGLTSLNAQTFDKAKMDSLFWLIENNEKGMGSVSLFQDGEEVYQKSYGYADVESKVKANSTTKYRIGSISKTFTATIIMKLIEDEKLSLYSTLDQFYPQIQNSDKITIKHLLQHRSGIANYTSVSDFFQWNTEKQTKKELINRIVSGGVTFNPNEKFEYSNSNYVLLTYIAENVSEKSFSELLNNIIVVPCHLKNTYIGSKINPDKNEAFSYEKLYEWKKMKETDVSNFLGAGFITSTPNDINTFLDNLFSYKIVNEESLKEMTTVIDNFGLGLMKVPFYNMVGFGHTGGTDGFHSNAFYFPEASVSVTILENGLAYPLNDIIIGVLSIFFDKEYQLPVFSEPVILKSKELNKYLGVYSSPTFPLKITITKKDNILICQATGQPSFPLECFAKDKFRYDPAKLELEFIPKKKKMILKQFGATFELTKE